MGLSDEARIVNVTLGFPMTNDRAARDFSELIDIMARLRAPGGCPWDREQSFDSIKPYLLEETYEVLDANRRASSPRAKRSGSVGTVSAGRARWQE